MQRILFIGHELSRTGAPIVLLSFLRWLHGHHPEIEAEVVVAKFGPLAREYEEVFPLTVLTPRSRLLRTILQILFLAKTFGWYQMRQIRKKNRSLCYDVVLSNTAANRQVFAKLGPMRCHIISWVHELEGVLADYVGLRNFEEVKANTHLFLAVSEDVRSNLIVNHGVAGDEIKLITEFVDPHQIMQKAGELSRIDVLRKLNLPKDCFLVGGSGTVDLRKGFDLFLATAKEICLKSLNQPVAFVWVGGSSNAQLLKQHRAFLDSEWGRKYFRQINSIENPYPFYSSFDVFLMTSREDPMPLVSLECALLEKPIFCFAKTGGTVDFVVKHNAGFVIAKLSGREMAQSLIEVIQNFEKYRPLGLNGSKAVCKFHNTDTVAEQVFAAMTFCSNCKERFLNYATE